MSVGATHDRLVSSTVHNGKSGCLLCSTDSHLVEPTVLFISQHLLRNVQVSV